jgi:hypothetical protein
LRKVIPSGLWLNLKALREGDDLGAPDRAASHRAEVARLDRPVDPFFRFLATMVPIGRSLPTT